MKFYRAYFIALLLFLTSSGCATATPTASSTIPSTHVPTVVPAAPTKQNHDWTGDDIKRLETPFGSKPDERLILYRVDPKRFAFRFAIEDAPQTLREWKQKNPKAILISNGVYFREDFSSAGLLQTMTTSTPLKRHFDWDKSGLIILAPMFAIINTASSTFDLAHAIEAAQSYPFLIKDGQAAVTKDSGQSSRRTFIGADQEGNVYLGIAPSAPLTLFELGHALQKLDIRWQHVLNLDGGPSSGLYARDPNTPSTKEEIDSYVPVPNILIVEPR